MRKQGKTISTPGSPGSGRSEIGLRTAFLVGSPYYRAVSEKNREELMRTVTGIRGKTHVRSQTLLPPLGPSQACSNGFSSAPPNISPVSSFFTLTRTGEVNNRPKAHNQDSCVAQAVLPSLFFFSVCDGHGEYGHHVSAYLRQQLPRHTLKAYLALEDKEVATEGRMSRALKEAYRRVVEGLGGSGVDVMFSGSTCVSVLVAGKTVVCANVGDSRAVLVKQIHGKWEARDLSTDHKPGLPSEQARIQAQGGRISPYRDSLGGAVGPLRVWMQDEDIPGLAMSRSIGDLLASRLGVSAEPEVLEKELEAEDKALILASDGLWEFFTSQEVAQIIGTYYTLGDLAGCTRRLVSDSVQRWRQADCGIDDITITLAFLRV